MVLFFKGIFFTEHSSYLVDVLLPLDETGTYLFLVHYIQLAHFAGGLCIMLGLLTRISVMVQIPIVLGAIVINFIGIMDPANLIQSCLCMVVLVFFAFFGSGKHSMDYSLKLGFSFLK